MTNEQGRRRGESCARCGGIPTGGRQLDDAGVCKFCNDAADEEVMFTREGFERVAQLLAADVEGFGWLDEDNSDLFELIR